MMKRIIYFFLLTSFTFLTGCAAVPKQTCIMKSVQIRPEKTGPDFEQIIFEIYFENCNELERSMLAKSEFEKLFESQNYSKYNVVDVFLTKRPEGKIYRVIYSVAQTGKGS